MVKLSRMRTYQLEKLKTETETAEFSLQLHFPNPPQALFYSSSFTTVPNPIRIQTAHRIFLYAISQPKCQLAHYLALRSGIAFPVQMRDCTRSVR
jgi:hypothetical protein